MSIFSVLRRRLRQRCCAAAVAGVARHVLLAVRKSAVDRTQHGDHSARNHLRLLLVGGLVLGMAVVARSLIQETQRLDEGLHGLRNGGGIQHLYVFEARPSSAAKIK